MVQRFEYFILESHRAKLFPDLLYGIHFWCVRRDTEQCDIFRHYQRFWFMPGRTITDKKNLILWILLRQFFQECVHAVGAAIWHDQKEIFSCYWLNCAIGISILTNMVAGNRRADFLPAPTALWLIDSSKPRLILKHQSDSWVRLALFSGFQHRLFNFFEASHASSFAAFGCFDRGITFRHPCRFNSM